MNQKNSQEPPSRFRFVTILVSAALLGAVCLPLGASADTLSSVPIGQVTFQDLQTTEPAILTGNPFYFLKNWSWGLKQLFTSNAVSEMLLQRDIWTEKAAEVKKIQSIASNDTDLISNALKDYQDAFADFNGSLRALSPSDFDGKNGAQTLEDTSSELFIHLRLIDDLSAQLTKNYDRAILADVGDDLSSTILWMAQNLQTPQEFSTQVLDAQKTVDPLIELRNAEMVLRLEKKAQKNDDLNLADALSSLYNKMMDDVSQSMAAEIKLGKTDTLVSELSRLVGQPAERMTSIENLTQRVPSLADISGIIDLYQNLQTRTVR